MVAIKKKEKALIIVFALFVGGVVCCGPHVAFAMPAWSVMMRCVACSLFFLSVCMSSSQLYSSSNRANPEWGILLLEDMKNC